MEGGSVNNVHVVGGSVSNSKGSGYGWSGGLIGEVMAGLPGASYSVCDYTSVTIKNCSTSNSVSGNSCTGGLIGFMCSNGYAINIENTWSSGSVTGADYATGGLIGYNVVYSGGSDEGNGTTTIKNCYATGNVTGADNWVGGFIGYNCTDLSGDKIIIQNCWASGNVSGKERTGGFVGFNDGIDSSSKISMSSCYSTGNVSGTKYVGGFVGYNKNTYSYASFSKGTVSGSSNTGGFDGYSEGATYSSCHFNNSTSDSGSGLTGHAASWWTEKNICSVTT